MDKHENVGLGSIYVRTADQKEAIRKRPQQPHACSCYWSRKLPCNLTLINFSKWFCSEWMTKRKQWLRLHWNTTVRMKSASPPNPCQYIIHNSTSRRVAITVVLFKLVTPKIWKMKQTDRCHQQSLRVLVFSIWSLPFVH